MRRSVCSLAALVMLALGTAADAATFRFDTDPFAGSSALVTPGRQVVGGEVSIAFSPASDLFSFDPGVFGVAGQVRFFNGLIGALPSSGVNVIVLQTFDNDNDPNTPFGAGNAANLIAAQVTSDGPGFFIYFNSGLDLPRLVYSTNLSDNTADLKILARMTNLTGQAGRDALSSFRAENFELVPEPSSLVLMAMAVACGARGYVSRRGRR